MEHSTPLPPLIFILILSKVRLGKGKVCPAGLGKRFSYGTAGLELPAGARIIKKTRHQK